MDKDGDGYYSEMKEVETRPGVDWYENLTEEECDDMDAKKPKNVKCTPCDGIRNQFLNEDYSTRYDELGTTKNFEKNVETGFSEKVTGEFVDLIPDGNRPINFKPTSIWKGVSHVHQNDFITLNKYMEHEVNKTVKIQSPTDVQQLLTLASVSRINGGPVENVYVDVLSSEGNYTLKFSGTKEEIQSLIGINTIDSAAETIYLDLVEEFGYKNVEKILLGFLEELNLNNVMSLYKIEKDAHNKNVAKQVLKDSNGVINFKDC